MWVTGSVVAAGSQVTSRQTSLHFLIAVTTPGDKRVLLAARPNVLSQLAWFFPNLSIGLQSPQQQKYVKSYSEVLHVRTGVQHEP